LNPTPDSVYGAIRTEEKARAAKDEATAERMDTIASIIGDPANPQPGSAFAAIQEEAKTRARRDEAEAKRVNELQAKLTTDLGEVRASIRREEQTRAGQDSALASSISTVQSRLNGNIASVQTLAQTVDGYGTKWATKLDSNGYITGLVMVNNGQGQSATVFHTDTFMVGKPGVNGGKPQYAFVIGTVNNRYQVVMNSAFIEDLSVSRFKIKGRTLTATAQNQSSYEISESPTGGAWTTDQPGLNVTVDTERWTPTDILMVAGVDCAGGSIDLRLRRDGTVLQIVPYFRNNSVDRISATYAFRDQPPTGRYTYYIDFRFSGGGKWIRTWSRTITATSIFR